MKYIVLLGLLVLFVAGCTTAPTGNTVVQTTQDAQIVSGWTEGPNYVFSPSAVKVGEPVRIEFDHARLPGCSQAVVIPSAGINKRITPTDNAVEFTPQSTGPLQVACTMNMYRGQLMVE